MSERLKKYATRLKAIQRASGKKRTKLVRCCARDVQFVHCISECCKNVLKGNVPLTPAQKVSLFRRRHKLRQLSLKKTTLKKKRRIIQDGGFLGALLGPIISILSGLFGGNNN